MSAAGGGYTLVTYGKAVMEDGSEPPPEMVERWRKASERMAHCYGIPVESRTESVVVDIAPETIRRMSEEFAQAWAEFKASRVLG